MRFGPPRRETPSENNLGGEAPPRRPSVTPSPAPERDNVDPRDEMLTPAATRPVPEEQEEDGVEATRPQRVPRPRQTRVPTAASTRSRRMARSTEYVLPEDDADEEMGGLPVPEAEESAGEKDGGGDEGGESVFSGEGDDQDSDAAVE